MTETTARTEPAGFVTLGCPVCQGSGSAWDDGVPLLASVASGQPMRAGREVDCPTCAGAGRFGRYWIRQQPATAWTVTVTDDRTGQVHEVPGITGEHARGAAASITHGILGRLWADTRTEEDSTELWEAIGKLAAAVHETTHRVEAHDQRFGIRVDVHPADPDHPLNP